MKVLKKIEPYILAIGVILCGTVLWIGAIDEALSIRHFIWACLTLILFISIIIRGDFAALRSPALWLFAGYVLFTAISGFQSVNRSEWLYQTLRTVLMLFFLFVAITIIDKKIISDGLIILAIVFCIVRLFGGENGLMCNRNLNAAAFMLLIPFCLMTRFKRIGKCIIYGGLIPIMVVNITLLVCRSVYIATGVVFLAFMKKRTVYTIIAIIITIAGFCLLFRYENVVNTASIQRRVSVSLATLKMIADNRFGVGAGNWQIIIPQYVTHFMTGRELLTEVLIRPHNDVLWILAETGIVGAMFYIGFFVYVLRAAWKKKNKSILAGLLGYLVFASFSIPSERAFHSIIMLVLAALAVKRKYEPLEFRPSPLLAVILVFIIVVFGFRHRASLQSLAVRETRDYKKTRTILKDISWFAALDGTTTPLHLYRAIARYEQGYELYSLEDFSKAYRLHPNNVHTIAVFGAVLSNMGRHNDARYYLTKMNAMKPIYKEKFIRKKR